MAMMMGHKSSIFFLLLVLIIPTAFSMIDRDYYVSNNCSHQPSNQIARDFVLGQLLDHAPLPQNKNIGFYYYPPNGKSSSKAGYGLAQCRQDITPTNCQTCLTLAKQELLKYCPTQSWGIVWQNHCTMKYADVGFLGNVDTSSHVYVVNDSKASPMGGPDFPAVSNKLMYKLYKSVLHVDANSFYSRTAQEGYLYGMSQCNRDIDQVDCAQCIQTAAYRLISQITAFKNVGQRLDYVSCSIRFDNNIFF